MHGGYLCFNSKYGDAAMGGHTFYRHVWKWSTFRNLHAWNGNGSRMPLVLAGEPLFKTVYFVYNLYIVHMPLRRFVHDHTRVNPGPVYCVGKPPRYFIICVKDGQKPKTPLGTLFLVWYVFPTVTIHNALACQTRYYAPGGSGELPV